MAEEIARLSAELAERMRELRAEPTDPRLAPLFTQLQALMRAHVAAAAAANAPAVPPVNYSFDLPPERQQLHGGDFLRRLRDRTHDRHLRRPVYTI